MAWLPGREKSQHLKETVGNILQPEVVTCVKPGSRAYSRAWQCCVLQSGEGGWGCAQHPSVAQLGGPAHRSPEDPTRFAAMDAVGPVCPLYWGLCRVCSCRCCCRWVNDKRLFGLWAGGGADWGCPGGEGRAPLLGPSVGSHCHRPGPALWPSGQGLGASPDRPSVLFPLLSCCSAGAFSGHS